MGYFSIVNRNSKINEIIVAASRFDLLSDFRKEKETEYMRAHHYGIFDDVTSHMKKKNSYTNEKLISMSKPYNNVRDFRKDHSSAYIIIRKRNLTEKCFGHFDAIRKRWREDEVKEIIEGYSNYSDLRDDHPKVVDYIYGYQKQHLISHLIRGTGGFNVTKPGNFYVAVIGNNTAVKIGITNRTFEERYNKRDLAKMTKIIEISSDGLKTKEMETKLKRLLTNYKYNTKLLESVGTTETFTMSSLPIIKRELNGI